MAGENDAGAGPDQPGDPIGAYKQLLRSYLDRRPSGTRQRIARAIDTHRSFVSQITNPAYRVPLPAQHVATIMAVCHFSAEEQTAFRAAYEAAHPGQLSALSAPARGSEPKPAHGVDQAGGVWIPLPAFADPGLAARVIRSIQEAAAAIVAVAEAGRERTDPDGGARDRSSKGSDR